MLKSGLKLLAKDSAFYGLAMAVSKLLQFITLPIIVRHISISEFGVYSILMVVGNTLGAAAIFGLDSAVARFQADETDLTGKRRVFSVGLILLLITTAIVTFFGTLFSGYLLQIIELELDQLDNLLLVVFWVPGYVINHYLQNWFKWTFRRFKFLLIVLGPPVFNLLILWTLILTENLNFGAVLASQTMAFGLFILIGLFLSRAELVRSSNSKLSVHLMEYGWPMMLVFLISVVTPSLDRLFLNQYLSESGLGVYSFGQKIGALMSLVVLGFQMAFGPLVYSIWNAPEAPRTIAKFQTYYLIVVGIFSIGLLSFAEPLILMFGSEEYLPSARYLPWLVMGSMIYGLYTFASIGIQYAKKNGFVLLSLLAGMAINIMVNYLLIPYYPERGATLGFMFGNLALVLVAYFLSAPYYSLSFFVLKDVFILVLIAITGNLIIEVRLWHHIWLDAFFNFAWTGILFIACIIPLLTAQERKFIVKVCRDPMVLIKRQKG